jgi:phosphohistidine phosphatase
LRIYLLRHGRATPRNSQALSDDTLRPLTREGKKKLILAVKGMKAAGLKVDRVLTSPLLRARQTARIVAASLTPPPALRPMRELSPDVGARELLERLSDSGDCDALLLVGHEPGLSKLAGRMLQGSGSDSPLELKKGGLCRIDFAGLPKAGAGRLIFHLPPRLLRRLGRRSC